MVQKHIKTVLDEFELLTKGRRNKIKPLTFGEQKESLKRTSGRTAEVMVKVTGGGKSVNQVYNHLTYITRNGDLEAVTEQGDKVSSRDELRGLLDEWGLETTRGYGRSKLAFNLMLSMPKGTNPERMYEAVQEFARDQFWDKHQYVMVMHDDRDHPHVHLCIKAQAEDGKSRLYIRKETLETWRQKFAGNLRDHGIEANATPRELRGVTRKSKKIGLYYAEKTGRSKVLKSKIEEVAKDIQKGEGGIKPWNMAIAERREFVDKLYRGAAVKLRKSGDRELADALESFADSLPPVVTERDLIGMKLSSLVKKGRAADTEKTGAQVEKGKVGHDQLLERGKTQPEPAVKSDKNKDRDR